MSTETASQTVARLEGKGWSASKILSGLGHPGYGAKFARQAVAAIKAGNVSTHTAVYGLLDGWKG